jgi:hypothetical protein
MSEPLYRRMSYTELVAQYGAITVEQFARVRARALNATKPGANAALRRRSDLEFVVLVEDVGDGIVQLLPADAAPHMGRTFWQKRA